MKFNALIRTLLLGAALSAGSLFANTVVLSSTGFNGGFNGGEFSALTSDNGTFVTFCIEKSVNVGLGATYSYTISPIASGGGADLQNSDPGDPVSRGTAWLFEKFFLGTLVAVGGSGNYTDIGTHNFNAGVLQKAFWALEDEATDVGNYYLGIAVAHFAGLGQNAYDDAAATSKVKAMNLWNSSGGDVQSQLILVPDNGMTVALLALGLLSLAAFRRKL